MPDPMALAYEERGSGPVLILIHGFPLDRTMWLAQLAGLAPIRRVVAVDLRGHGLSHDPSPDDYSMDLFADDVAATLAEIGQGKADVCGLSMGGYVALTFWRRHPELVRSLLLCCTKAEADTEEVKRGREQTAAMVREPDGLQRLYEQLEDRMLGPKATDEVKAAMRRMFTDIPPDVAAADLLAMRDRPDMAHELPRITVPTLWIAGEEDSIMPLDAARASAQSIPGARFVPIPEAGHLAPMESPEAVNAALAEFLTGVGAG